MDNLTLGEEGTFRWIFMECGFEFRNKEENKVF